MSIKLRNELAQDRYYKFCCLSILSPCVGHIEWHHNLIHAGRQINERAFILPLCYAHHRDINVKAAKEMADWIMLNRASNVQLKKYSKAVDYIALRETLNKKYGKYREPLPTS